MIYHMKGSVIFMKHISKWISAILCLIMVFAMVGCGHQDLVDESTIGQTETVIDSATDPVLDETDHETAPIVTTEPSVSVPELTYKMAPIYKVEPEEQKYGYTELWFAVEFTELGWQPAYRDAFIITNTMTGDVLNDLESPYYGGADIDWYVGSVCVDDHILDGDAFYLRSETDYLLATICITSAAEIDFDDLSIVCNAYYVDEYATTESESHELAFNANISEITTRQTYIHDSTLFELDGKYYVINSASSGGGGSDTIQYRCFNAIPINGTYGDLVASLKDNIQLVYGNVLADNFLQPIVIPDTCNLYVDVGISDDDIAIGFEGIDGHVITDEEDSLCWDAIFVYQFDDGQMMAFIY